MITLCWDILEILINYSQGFIQIFFINSLLEPKKKNTNIIRLLFSGIIGTLISVFNHYTIFEGFVGMIIYCCINLVFALFYLNGNILKKIFYSVIPVIVIALISVFTLNFFSTINHIDIMQIVSGHSIPRLMVLLSTQLLIFIFLKILIKLFSKGRNDFNNSEFIIMLVYLVLTSSLSFGLHMMVIDHITEKQRLYINISFFIIILINIVDFVVIDILNRKNIKIKEYELNKLHKEYQNRLIEDAKLQSQTLGKIQHDLKNSWQTLYDLIDKGNNEIAKQYISENITVIKSLDSKVFTNNDIVNSVINSKLSFASAMGIEVTCLLNKELDGVTDIDWCNLISNLLDNAITACMEIDNNAEKHIELTISKSENIYTLITTNSIKESVIMSNPDLHTTKQDTINHGMGTKIIKEISQKYFGSYLFYEENNDFVSKVMLRV